MNAFTIPKSTFAQQMQANRKMARTPSKNQQIFIPPAADKYKRDWIAARFAR